MIQSYKKKYTLEDSYDVLMIGSGMGCLSAASILAKEGKKVLILERHYTAGGFTHVFKRRGQRRITVNYAKRQQGRKMVQGQASYLPMKINQAGVIPAIFASSLLLFPASASTWFGQGEGFEWLQEIALALGPGQPLYVILFSALIAFFCFFLPCSGPPIRLFEAFPQHRPFDLFSYTRLLFLPFSHT